ncbi:MAG: DUF4116 domain-containing protein, partial [Cyanobacteria bacterium WB6_1B_304]|nr:DUF4116 domain-containing protein [Cyanobacteria bacterium WB6_1B_304]
MKKDRQVVLAAVAKNGFALEFASHELKNDEILQKVSNLNIV